MRVKGENKHELEVHVPLVLIVSNPQSVTPTVSGYIPSLATRCCFSISFTIPWPSSVFVSAEVIFDEYNIIQRELTSTPGSCWRPIIVTQLMIRSVFKYSMQTFKWAHIRYGSSAWILRPVGKTEVPSRSKSPPGAGRTYLQTNKQSKNMRWSEISIPTTNIPSI